MSSTISVQMYEGARRVSLATILFILTICVFCPTAVRAVAGAAHKTDAELSAALIGNWEARPTKKSPSFRKVFLTLNADGTFKAIGITNDRASPRRVEVEARWRVSNGKLIADAIKTSPANRGILSHFELRDHIESIEDGTVKLRDEKGEKEEMLKISQLPTLPPLLIAAKPATIYAPTPEYPLAARQRRWTGAGLFACNIRRDGTVASINVLQSTGHDMLDQAAIAALRRWKFKPGGSNVVRVPLRFTMGGGVRHRMSGAVISD